MTEKQAREILLHTVVMWDNDPRIIGTVNGIGLNGLFVNWSDGQSGWIEYKDCKKISRY